MRFPALLARALAGGAVAALAAAPAPAVAPDPTPGQVEPSVSIGDGTVLLILKSKPRLRKAELLSAHPCLSYTYSAERVQVCVSDEHWAKVRRTGTHARPPYRIPYRLQRLSGRSVAVAMRQSDVALPAGRATAEAWCRKVCRRSARPVRVFPLQLRSCEATRPWLVHGAPRQIGKAVALTFDDGPGAMTKDVLKILRRARVSATFFPVGVMAQQRPQLLPKIMAGGHVLGNHSWSHILMHGGAVSQITDVQRLVQRESGFRPCLFRAPYGENPPDVVALARSLRLTTVHWNVDPGDWRGASADAIVATALQQSKPGSISVLHDGGSHRQMLAALPRYIDAMHRRRYRFVTVPELLQLPMSYLGKRQR